MNGDETTRSYHELRGRACLTASRSSPPVQVGPGKNEAARGSLEAHASEQITIIHNLGIRNSLDKDLHHGLQKVTLSRHKGDTGVNKTGTYSLMLTSCLTTSSGTCISTPP